MKMSKRGVNALDKLIERIYYNSCSGVQIDIMDINKVFKTGQAAMAANPSMTVTDLTKVIVDFVQTIRKN